MATYIGQKTEIDLTIRKLKLREQSVADPMASHLEEITPIWDLANEETQYRLTVREAFQVLVDLVKEMLPW